MVRHTVGSRELENDWWASDGSFHKKLVLLTKPVIEYLHAAPHASSRAFPNLSLSTWNPNMIFPEDQVHHRYRLHPEQSGWLPKWSN